ncbi:MULTISPECIES: GGDEF domain-containing phosphodiesterase [Gordonia]|uniref:GGDEF domain-containing phosphodiesterase n=1 Tax=Gordonia tangerina TaxID=2911060 RepID=A0ABS9DNI7_9ACTN|nr:GGDEF domain-containing phosphodiesterase [Gordonia tangerina]MCF3940164.1 GGDEF domain-containing phosphodiesterase [Gordonia tangerina]
MTEPGILAATTAIAVAADPYHRAAVILGRAQAALIAQRFVDHVLRPLDTTAEFERSSDYEWLILLHTEAGPALVVDAVRSDLRSRHVSLGDEAYFLDIYMGIAFGADLPDAATSDDLIRHADAALSAALTQHRNVVFADPRTPRRIRADVDIATRLSGSVQNDFVLHYQPIVTLPGRRIVGYESLLRWNTESGLLPPDAFLAVAEDTSLILPIGRHVIGEAIRTLSAKIVPAIGTDAFVSINLSTQQLRDRGIAADIGTWIHDHGVRPEQIWIEVRENEVIDIGTPAALAIQQLHELGCIICVDDLGAGFSALRYVRDLPIDVLKVDKTLVDNLLSDGASSALVRAICDVARATGAMMVAEGVEDEELVPALQQLSFEFAQGFLFGHPSPHV